MVGDRVAVRSSAGNVDSMGTGRVVLVEDDAGMRQAVERLLVAGGYPVSAFASAEAFLGSPAVRQADCLVLDVRLPGLSGVELRQRLVAQGVHVPVIFMTAHDDPRTRAQVEAAAPVAYLMKPFAGRQLLDAVARALATP
jgi:FixJ family two-component response regulator